MEFLTKVATPGIAVICYLIIEVLKRTPLLKKGKHRDLIPIICCIIGIAVSTAMYFIVPTWINCENYLEAFATGGISGVCATGVHQLWKKASGLVKEKKKKDDDDDKFNFFV